MNGPKSSERTMKRRGEPWKRGFVKRGKGLVATLANIYKGDDPMNAKTVPDLLETLFGSTDPRVATAICRMPSKRSKAPQLIITVGLVIETNCRLSQCCMMV